MRFAPMSSDSKSYILSTMLDSIKTILLASKPCYGAFSFFFTQLQWFIQRSLHIYDAFLEISLIVVEGAALTILVKVLDVSIILNKLIFNSKILHTWGN